jgi:hypothetical protein
LSKKHSQSFGEGPGADARQIGPGQFHDGEVVAGLRAPASNECLEAKALPVATAVRQIVDLTMIVECRGARLLG